MPISGLCKEQWPRASIYDRERRSRPFKQVYLSLDEGTLTFNSDPEKVIHLYCCAYTYDD